MSRWPWVTAAVATAAVWLSATGAERLLLDTGTGPGATWWTSHLVHHSPTHLFWDVGAFVVVGAALEARSRWLAVATLLLSATAVAAGMVLTLPSDSLYGGLSGVDAALFTALLASILRQSEGRLRVGAVALGLGFLAKLAFELTSGTVLFAGGDGVLHAPWAHIFGAVTGLAAHEVAGLSCAQD